MYRGRIKKIWFSLFLLAGFLIGCSPKSTPPGANSVGAVLEEAVFSYHYWEEGLAILIWHDFTYGGEGCSGTGSTEDPVYRLECTVESIDGRSFSWQVHSRDGITADMWIDGQKYDLSQGTMFLIKSQDGALQVDQVQRDFSELVPSYEAISALADSDPAVMEFIESIRPQNHSSDAAYQDAQAYAAEYNVDVDEALNRLSMQDTIGELNARLQSEEKETFAGLWVEHEPSYRVVVAFTRDGETSLAPYVDDTSLAEIVEVQTAVVTYETLQTIQAETNRLLEPLGITFSSGINVQENLVELYITDQAAFDAAIQANDVHLPEHLNVVTLYEPLGDELPFEINPNDSIYFPQLKTRSTSFMEALLIGRLEVENGCLQTYQEESDQHITIIWQTDYFLNNNDGSIEMLDREGKVVARVGEMIYLGGGEVSSIDANLLQAPIPDRCSGSPLWLMGEFLPEEYIPNVSGDTN